jgi:DNA-binding cell septation regulator SpoVG
MVNGLKITEISVYPVANPVEGSAVLGYARIVLNDSLIINGIRIISGKYGPFLGWPQEYNLAEKRGYDICFPINIDLRKYATNKVLTKYEASKKASEV